MASRKRSTRSEIAREMFTFVKSILTVGNNTQSMASNSPPNPVPLKVPLRTARYHHLLSNPPPLPFPFAQTVCVKTISPFAEAPERKPMYQLPPTPKEQSIDTKSMNRQGIRRCLLAHPEEIGMNTFLVDMIMKPLHIRHRDHRLGMCPEGIHRHPIPIQYRIRYNSLKAIIRNIGGADIRLRRFSLVILQRSSNCLMLRTAFAFLLSEHFLFITY